MREENYRPANERAESASIQLILLFVCYSIPIKLLRALLVAKA